MVRILGLSVAAFLGAAIVAYAAVLFGTLTVWEWTGVVDRDGGGAMGLAFVIGPAVALLVGGAAAALTGRRLSRRPSAPATGGPAAVTANRGRLRHVLAGLIGGGLGYVLVYMAQWLASPVFFDTYIAALAYSWLPILALFAGAVLGVWSVTPKAAR